MESIQDITVLFMLWQQHTREAEKNNKKSKSWLEWLFG